jgi:hypothetical protein
MYYSSCPKCKSLSKCDWCSDCQEYRKIFICIKCVNNVVKVVDKKPKKTQTLCFDCKTA